MPRELKKYSIRAYEEDIATISAYYPDFGYNRIIRHFVTQLAEQIRQGKADPLESTIQNAAYGEVND